MKKSLSEFTSKKNEQLTKDTETKKTASNRVGVTLRLNRDEWERLHYLSIQERTKIQTLLMEGLNDVFIKRGLPSIG